MAADGCEAMDGLEFLTRRPEDTRLWGDGNKLLWVRGQGLMICGPQGVGKSTMAQQLMLARMGLRAAELAGHTVAGDDRPVLCGDFVETVCDKSDSCAKPANSLARADIVFNLRLDVVRVRVSNLDPLIKNKRFWLLPAVSGWVPVPLGGSASHT